MSHNQKILENLDSFILTAMQAWEIPGLAVAILKNDQVVLCKGYGVCEIGRNDPVDEHTLFGIGSNTKAFTATALGLLVQEGKLSWDDAVTKHMPGFQLSDPFVTRAITIRDLLCHRSGLPTWGGDLLFYGSHYTREEIIYRTRFIQPAFSFRSGFGYSNLMFLAAGQIIPAVTGMSWDDFIQQRLFSPLNMTRSNASISSLSRSTNVATPHQRIGDQIRCLPYRNLDNLAPAGAINSSALDMAQWLHLQLKNGVYDEKQLVDEAIIEETRTPHNPLRIPPSVRTLIPSRHFAAYGLGWSVMDYQGRLLIQHGGGIDGMFSLVGLVPEEMLGIVVLSNKIPHNLNTALLYQVIDAYLDVPYKDWNRIFLEQGKSDAEKTEEQKKKIEEGRVKDTQPALPLEKYAGAYTNQIYGDVKLDMDHGKLVLHLSAHPNITGELEHWHYDTFLCRWNDPIFDQSLVPFLLDGQGKVERFRVTVRQDWIDTLEYEFCRAGES